MHLELISLYLLLFIDLLFIFIYFALFSLVFSSRLESRTISDIYRGMHYNINCKVYRRFVSVDTHTHRHTHIIMQYVTISLNN